MSTVAAQLHPAVREYLESLELELKKVPGLTPEDGLADAREFLQSELEQLEQNEPTLGDDEIHHRLVERFGPPTEVAASYAEGADAVVERPGIAPGWRICCCSCGRSAPAARVGITKIGARAHHKYTAGFCRHCGRFRWLRLLRDLEEPNLTAALGMDRSPAEVRKTMHRPVAVVVSILVGVFLFFAAVNIALWLVFLKS